MASSCCINEYLTFPLVKNNQARWEIKPSGKVNVPSLSSSLLSLCWRLGAHLKLNSFPCKSHAFTLNSFAIFFPSNSCAFKSYTIHRWSTLPPYTIYFVWRSSFDYKFQCIRFLSFFGRKHIYVFYFIIFLLFFPFWFFHPIGNPQFRCVEFSTREIFMKPKMLRWSSQIFNTFLFCCLGGLELDKRLGGLV